MLPAQAIPWLRRCLKLEFESLAATLAFHSDAYRQGEDSKVYQYTYTYMYNTYICTHTHVYVAIYVYVCMCIYIYIYTRKKRWFVSSGCEHERKPEPIETGHQWCAGGLSLVTQHDKRSARWLSVSVMPVSTFMSWRHLTNLQCAVHCVIRVRLQSECTSVLSGNSVHS